LVVPTGQLFGSPTAVLELCWEPDVRWLIASGFLHRGKRVTQPHEADFWRRRAQEARALAEIMTLPLARREMEHIAAAYERLAKRAERVSGCKGTSERP
jgi:hypothetical protein